MELTVNRNSVYEDLLPCPFCGSTPRLEPRGSGKIRAIVCDGTPCAGSGLFVACNDDEIEKAIAVWNTRAELQRRQQPLPVGEGASVPVELVKRWHAEACEAWPANKAWGFTKFTTEYVANKAAAYGREQVQQWQPIETAPKDGTAIIVFHPVGGVCEAWCPKDGFAWHCLDGTNTHAGDKSGVQIPTPTTFVNQPTHWMPLPEPPNDP